METEEFTEANKSNFATKRPFVPLTIDVKKLQTKYNNIKSDWRKINDRRKNGSGKSPENEPLWFGIINPILCDANKGLEEVVSNRSETSYVANIVNKRQSTRSPEHVNKSDEDYESYDSDISDIE